VAAIGVRCIAAFRMQWERNYKEFFFVVIKR
jgi:hypothetical protein